MPEASKVGGHQRVGKTDFADYVKMSWLRLAPGQFYGLVDSRFANLLKPGQYSLVVEYYSSAFPWVLAGETLKDVQKSAKKLQSVALLGRFRSNEVRFTVAS